MKFLPWMMSLLAIGAGPGPAVSADRAPAPWAVDLVGRIGELETVPRQVWLLRLEQRRDYANRILKRPEEADRERQQTARLLRQPMISPDQLAELLQQTDALEKEAIGRMVRRYRSENEKQFHAEAGRLAKRYAAWNALYRAWQRAGQNFEEQDRLLVWLRAALRQMAEPSAPLPPEPPFTPRDKLQNPVGLARSMLPVFREPKAGGEGPTLAAEPPPIPMPETPIVAGPAPSEIPPTAVRRRLETSKEDQPATVERRSFFSSPAVATPTVSQAVATVPPAVPAAAVAERSLPGPQAFAMSPHGEEHVVRRVPPPSEEIPVSTPPTVEVNRDELLARIKGRNMTLRSIEAELGEPKAGNIEQLEEMMERLAQVVRQGRDLQLVRDLLSVEELRGMDDLESPRTAIALMGRRIYEIRSALAGESGRNAEQKRLDALSRRLAELALEK
ncbi:MAG: hypothetical protein JXB10_12665 [Pirellulales bacterium]|nr:hypothetical protein [Pirellulales bacterium]